MRKQSGYSQLCWNETLKKCTCAKIASKTGNAFQKLREIEFLIFASVQKSHSNETALNPKGELCCMTVALACCFRHIRAGAFFEFFATLSLVVTASPTSKQLISFPAYCWNRVPSKAYVCHLKSCLQHEKHHSSCCWLLKQKKMRIISLNQRCLVQNCRNTSSLAQLVVLRAGTRRHVANITQIGR